MILKNTIKLFLILTIVFIGVFSVSNPVHALWTFEDKFNSDTKTTGDLNGQDGWSGSTAFDIVTTDPFEGDQHVNSTSGNGTVINTFTAVADGTFYYSFQRVDTTGDCEFDVELSGGANRIRYILGNGGGDMALTVSDGAGLHTLLATIATGQWYTVELNFANDDTHTSRVHDGTSWSTLSGTLDATTGNGGDIAQVNLGAGGGAGECYFDDITATNPFPDAVEEGINWIRIIKRDFNPVFDLFKV